MLIVGFYTPQGAQDASTVEIPWPGGDGVLDVRLDVGGFDVAVTDENAPHGIITWKRGTQSVVLFDERTTSTTIRRVSFKRPKGSIIFRSFCDFAGASGELRAQLEGK